MRWIDGDVLYDYVEAKYRLSSGEEHKAERALLDAICEMPTIDAIPVEWLKAQIKSYTGDVSDIGKSARNGAIKDLIRKWQKEQGAQDG